MDDDALDVTEPVTVNEGVTVTEPVCEALEVADFDGLMEDEGELVLETVTEGDELMEIDAVLDDDAEVLGEDDGVLEDVADDEMVDDNVTVRETVILDVTEFDGLIEEL